MKKFKKYSSDCVMESSSSFNDYKLGRVNDLLNTAIRIVNKSNRFTLLYFNSNGIYTEYSPQGGMEYIENLPPCGNRNYFWYLERIVKDDAGEDIYICLNRDSSRLSLPFIIEGVRIFKPFLIQAISTLIPGVNTLEDLVGRYNYIVENQVLTKSDTNIIRQVPLDFNYKYPTYNPTGNKLRNKVLESMCIPDEVVNFVYKISIPRFEREPENRDIKTFDFIRVNVSIPSKKKCPKRKIFIENNIRYITAIVLGNIKERKVYQKYGVPVEYLKIEKLTITKSDELEMLFRLKEINKTN